MIDLRQGDCLEIMKSIESGSIDAIITDPPYGTTACKWDSVIPFDAMWEQLNRIIKPNGAIVLFGSEPFSSAMIMSNVKDFKYRWTWNKIKASNHLNSRRQPLRCVEDIAVFYKRQPAYNPQLRDRLKKNIRDPKKPYGKGNNNTYGKTEEGFVFNSGREIPLQKGYPLDLVEFSQVGSFGSKRQHPTQKPVELMEYLIKTYTNEQETVLDFTMGSGTTGVACKNLNRNFIGIELDENYFNIAKERIETI
ncbi:MAG: site-specific DNA-methyltransferase [Colwellia sp.]|nr:site-specific DNA-methyltransferase [Colwellia sp.]